MKISISATLCFLMLISYSNAIAQELEIVYPNENHVLIRPQGLIYLNWNNDTIDIDTTMYYHRARKFSGMPRYLNVFDFKNHEKVFQLLPRGSFKKIVVYRDSSKRDTLIVAYPAIVYDAKSSDSLMHHPLYPDSTVYSQRFFRYYKSFFLNGETQLIYEQHFFKDDKTNTIQESFESKAWYSSGERRWKRSLKNNRFCIRDSAWHKNGMLSVYFDLSKEDTVIKKFTYPNGNLKMIYYYQCSNKRVNSDGCIQCRGTKSNELKPILIKSFYFEQDGIEIERWPLDKCETILGKDSWSKVFIIDTTLYHTYRYYSNFKYEIGDTAIFSYYPGADTLVVFYDSTKKDTAIINLYSEPGQVSYPTAFLEIGRTYDRNRNLIALYDSKDSVDFGWYANGKDRWNLKAFDNQDSRRIDNGRKDKYWWKNGTLKGEVKQIGSDTICFMEYYMTGDVKLKHYFLHLDKVDSTISNRSRYQIIRMEGTPLLFCKTLYYHPNGQFYWSRFNHYLRDSLCPSLIYHENGNLEGYLEYYGTYIYGRYETFYENGTPKIKGQYSLNHPKLVGVETNVEPEHNDQIKSYKVGSWRYYDKSGTLIRKEYFEKGTMIRSQIFD